MTLPVPAGSTELAPASTPLVPTFFTDSQTARAVKYEREWHDAQLRPERLAGVMVAAKRILAGRDRYKEIEDVLGVPWPVIGIIHERESSCNFATHLHNGDSLKKRTVHVPAGRPLAGSPPFNWVESAIDALKMKAAEKFKVWTIGATGVFWEQYNGDGYFNRGLPSPYVLAGTDLYVKGKYVKDGKFDKNFVDPQPGAFALLLCLLKLDPSIQGEDAEPLIEVAAEKPITIAPPAPTPSTLSEATKSKTVHLTFWGTVFLKATAVASAIGSAFDWAFSSLPDIKTDVDAKMAIVNSLASVARIDLATVGTWIGVALLLCAISRHIDLKKWLNRGGVA